MRKHVLVLFAALFLFGCVSAPEPRTAEQTAYVAMGSYIAVAKTTAVLTERGLITADQASEIKHYLGKIRPRLERLVTAVRHGRAIPNTGVEWLIQVNRVLQQILVEIRDEQHSSNS